MRVVIVGAGMSGLCMGVALRRAGIPFVILEKARRLGGTWWDNTYPGCACDIPSHLYAFSFAPEPEWSRVYPPQAEILGYLERLAATQDLLPRIRFGVTVEAARWDEAAARWRVALEGGEEVAGDVLVSAVGALHVPKYPDLPGRERFRGPAFHSARWDHEVDLRGQRVGVVGNAASAVQLVPPVAEVAREVYVFQRTAHWVLPRLDGAYPPWARRAFRFAPVQRLYRWWLYLVQEVLFLLAFHHGSAFGRLLRRTVVRRIRRQVRDPAVQEALIPGYPPGCKRALLSNDYYRTLDRPHVHLVTDRLVAVREEGLETERGAREVDAIVYATGFDPLAWGHVEVFGRGGRRLSERWGRTPRAHLGITVPGFPNYFVLLGPNTGLGHNSVMWMVECQVDYVMGCLKAMRRRGLRTLEVTEEALARSSAELDRRMAGRVWSSCRSWYQNEDGKVVALWPATTVRYWWETRRPALERDFVAGRA